jgi:hypothetical protein
MSATAFVLPEITAKAKAPQRSVARDLSQQYSTTVYLLNRSENAFRRNLISLFQRAMTPRLVVEAFR